MNDIASLADSQGNLLFVDDDADGRAVLVRRFARRNFQTSEAGHGEAALELLERVNINVAILYDALYVALAEQEACPLITADDKLVLAMKG